MKKFKSIDKAATLVLGLVMLALTGCSGSSASNYEALGLEVPTTKGDTLYLKSGVKFTYLEKGEGPIIDSLADVQTHINLIVKEDTVWTTYGQRPFAFTAKKTSLIDGFDAVVMYLKEGDRIMAVIPPEEGYGPDDYGGGLIPGNSTLFFDLDILEVVPLDTAKLP